MKQPVSLEQLPPELQREILKANRIRRPRKHGLSSDALRGWAFRVLAALASLPGSDRERVLRHASKLNHIKVRGE